MSHPASHTPLHPALRATPQQVRGNLFSRKGKRNYSQTIIGFTLIEILIVIVIMSILSGIAILTMTRNQQKQLGYFADSLSHYITLAEQEAMLRPATLGLAFTSTSFQFFQYKTKNKRGWQALTDKIYGLHPVPNTTQLILRIQNKTVPLDGLPQIIISMSGDITPFTLLIGKKGQEPIYQITGDANGEIRNERVHEE